jgi:hypothetical protein
MRFSIVPLKSCSKSHINPSYKWLYLLLVAELMTAHHFPAPERLHRLTPVKQIQASNELLCHQWHVNDGGKNMTPCWWVNTMFQSNLSSPSKSEKFKRVEYLDLKTEKTSSFWMLVSTMKPLFYVTVFAFYMILCTSFTVPAIFP